MDVYSGVTDIYAGVSGMGFRSAEMEELAWRFGSASYGREGNGMKAQVRITRTDTGSNTRIKTDNEHEASKDYASWDDALAEAERMGLLNGIEATAAKVLPPGMPYHTNCIVDAAVLNAAGFTNGKASPPQ
jgi:hypothetical protein